MRRVAANIVYLKVKEFHKYHIVELFDNIAINHYNLIEELLMIGWLGGIILLTHANNLELEGINSIDDFYDKAENWEEQSGRYFAYHIDKVLSPSTKFRTNDGSCYCHIKRF